MMRFLPGPFLNGNRPARNLIHSHRPRQGYEPPAAVGTGFWLRGGGPTRGFIHSKAFTLADGWVSLGRGRFTIHGSWLL